MEADVGETHTVLKTNSNQVKVVRFSEMWNVAQKLRLPGAEQFIKSYFQWVFLPACKYETIHVKPQLCHLQF